MSQVLDALVEDVLKAEGGIGTNANDRGGRTAFGQTEDWCDDYGLPMPANVEQATANYLTWLSVTDLDKVCTVYDALSRILVDAAVNTGTSRAIEALQRAVGTTPDGAIGPQTLAAVAAADREAVAAAIWRDHGDACMATVLNDPLLVPMIAKTQLAFLRGWWNRLKGQVTRIA